MKQQLKHIIELFFLPVILSYSVLFSWNRAYAGNPPETPDRIITVLNKSFYVTGETIWYKIYLLNRDPETRVLHVGLFDPSGKLRTDQKLKIENGSADGSMEIPIEWPDGNYRFEVLTRWNLNFGAAGLNEVRIPIYNSSLPGNYSSSSYEILAMPDSIERYLVTSPHLQLSFNNNHFYPGDTAELIIRPRMDDDYYNLSVSITDLSQIPEEDDSRRSDQLISSGSLANAVPAMGPVIFNPEKNLSLEALLKNPDNSSLIDSKVLSVYLSSRKIFLRTGTQKGLFRVDLPDIYKDETIQVFNLNPFQDPMPLIQPVSIWDQVTFGALHDASPPHTPDIDQYIYHTRLRRKINEIFLNTETIIYKGDSAGKSLPPANMKYDMSKFKLLNDLEDFIRSVVLNVRHMKKNGVTTLRLFNDQTEYYFMYHPWYLVDGLFTFDESSVLSTPFPVLTSVNFYTNYKSIYKFDPLMILNGIISITTNDHHWEKMIRAYPNTLNYKGFSVEKRYDEILHVNNPDSGIPDLRPVVFWDPDIILQAGLPAVIKFRTTDNPGFFLVKITGIDGNGSVIHASAVYEVTNRQK